MDNERIKTLNKTELLSLLSDENIVNFVFNYKSNNKLSSTEESSFLAHIMHFFKPLTLRTEGNKDIILGKYKKYTVKFLLQQKVRNNKTKRYFTLDLLLQLIDDDEGFLVCQIALEYDGADRHLLQYGVIRDKQRDFYVFSEAHLETLRFDTSMLNTNEKISDIGKALKKYFDHSLKRVKESHQYYSKITTKNIPLLSELKKNFHKCPLCEGVLVLGTDFCMLCHGRGVVKNEIYFSFNIEDYVDESYNCPECRISVKSSPKQSCTVCIGKGSIDREQAIKYQQENT
ncbi:hypothetical protein KP24_00040 [Pectobacterium atrosepticum]|uniref:hypothetical protein n=1 Tax=Pectobacterium atrosepticum TaxID=29471 RepID=UPI000505C9F5|nr:hypothetical protein [Pectobacterium atrosepticum]KFX25117.1 hypothetical protein KP24_00040 [Pectobacterium atrosepticum]